MKKEKILELLNKEEFLKKIMILKTPEEVQKIFKDNNIDVSLEEVQSLGDEINLEIARKTKELNENELCSISGGVNFSAVNILNMAGYASVMGIGVGCCLWGIFKTINLLKKSSDN